MKIKPRTKKRQFFEKNIGDTIYTGRITEEDENDTTQPSRVSTVRTKISNDEFDSDEIQPNLRVSITPKTRSTRVNHHLNLSAQNLFMGTFNKNDSNDSSSS